MFAHQYFHTFFVDYFMNVCLIYISEGMTTTLKLSRLTALRRLWVEGWVRRMKFTL